jgi:hypothetical protein
VDTSSSIWGFCQKSWREWDGFEVACETGKREVAMFCWQEQRLFSSHYAKISCLISWSTSWNDHACGVAIADGRKGWQCPWATRAVKMLSRECFLMPWRMQMLLEHLPKQLSPLTTSKVFPMNWSVFFFSCNTLILFTYVGVVSENPILRLRSR